MRAGILSIVAIAALLVAVPSYALSTSASPTPKPAAHHTPKPRAHQTPKPMSHHTPIPLPVIYHGTARPLCAALVKNVRPVIGMLIQNEETIAKSPPLLQRYNRDLSDTNNSIQSGADNAERDMTLYHLEQLVTPLVNNIQAAERELDDTSIFPANPQTEDQKQLDELREELLKVLATQAVSLDIINGYVQTQQLAEMQTQGLQDPNMQAATGADMIGTPAPTTPNPMLVDPNQAGIQQNPYEMDPLAVPGITGSVGHTPVSRLIDAMEWLRTETNRRAGILDQSVVQAANSCKANPTEPAATPSP